MAVHEFTLTFRPPDPEGDPTEFLDPLFEAGCDDALVSCGRTGSVTLDFDRDAPSEDLAIASATADVLKAIPGAVLVETQLAPRSGDAPA